MNFCEFIKKIYGRRKMKKVLDRTTFPLGEHYVDKINARFTEGDEITLCIVDYDFAGENIFDEDASFRFEDHKFASKYTRRFNEMWNRDVM